MHSSPNEFVRKKRKPKLDFNLRLTGIAGQKRREKLIFSRRFPDHHTLVFHEFVGLSRDPLNLPAGSYVSTCEKVVLTQLGRTVTFVHIPRERLHRFHPCSSRRIVQQRRILWMTGCIISLYGQRVSVINTPPLITRTMYAVTLTRANQLVCASLASSPCFNVCRHLCAHLPPAPLCRYLRSRMQIWSFRRALLSTLRWTRISAGSNGSTNSAWTSGGLRRPVSKFMVNMLLPVYTPL